MAILKVKELKQKATSHKTWTESTATHVWSVVTDVPTSPVAIEQADDGTTQVPQLTNTHPDDASRTVRSIDPQPVDDSLKAWEVTVEYSNVQSELEQFENPLDVPDEISWQATEATEAVFRDIEDTPIVNSAGEPFDNFVERESGELACTVTRNQATYSPATAISYLHKVNSAGFSIAGQAIGIGEAKMGAIGASRQKSNGVTYWKVTYPMKFKPDWRTIKLEDRGYNELAGPGGAEWLAEIVKGEPPVKVDKPYPLEAGVAKAVSTDAPAELEFKLYEQASFAGFAFA